MAIGVYTDFKVYNEEYYGGIYEALEQESELFNAASANTIQLIPRDSRGHFEKEGFFQLVSDAVVRRDISSTSSVDDKKLESEEFIRPKINRRIGPIANTLDSLRKIASNQAEFSFVLGQQVGKAKAVDYVNTAVLACTAALLSESRVQVDVTGTSKLKYEPLVDALAKFGDKGWRLAAWVMHSRPFYDLMKENITQYKIDAVAGVTIYNGLVGSLNRPIIVVDSPSLVNTDGIESGTDSYYTLGLTTDALQVIESEGDEMVFDIVTGLANLVVRMQGEHAYNVGVRGYAYTHATVNPTDANLGSSANWANRMADVKSTAGVIIEHQ
jgi:hypothetical protein